MKNEESRWFLYFHFMVQYLFLLNQKYNTVAKATQHGPVEPTATSNSSQSDWRKAK